MASGRLSEAKRAAAKMFSEAPAKRSRTMVDGVEGIAGGRNDLVPTVGIEVEDLLLVLFDDTQLLDFLWGKRAAFLGDKVPT